MQTHEVEEEERSGGDTAPEEVVEGVGEEDEEARGEFGVGVEAEFLEGGCEGEEREDSREENSSETERSNEVGTVEERMRDWMSWSKGSCCFRESEKTSWKREEAARAAWILSERYVK